MTNQRQNKGYRTDGGACSGCRVEGAGKGLSVEQSMAVDG